MRGQVQAIAQWAARRPLMADGVLAVTMAGLLWAFGAAGRNYGDGWTCLLIAALTVPLAWRRQAPLVVFAVLAAVAFLQWLTTDPIPADVTLLVALYSVAAYERRRWGFVAAFSVFELGALLATLRFGAHNALISFTTLSAFIVAAGTLGIYVRTRREHIGALTARAAQLERERDQQAQLATAAERARIAREMHDVVAHNLTVMVALADGARMTTERSPEEAEAAMRAVSATGREALAEMRRLLGVLRDDGHGDATELQPQPGIAQLDGLLEQVRSAGLETRLTRTGDPVPLSPGAQLTVYRVVQEALTNTIKHAQAPSAAEVSLHYTESALSLDVTDDGAPVPAGWPGDGKPREGRGIEGMRERVAPYGAEVEAGPQLRGGWRVHAVLRLEDAVAR